MDALRHRRRTGATHRDHEPADEADGYRVLVDRLWPRGLSKEAAALDEWVKEIAPSQTLRRWFNHEPARWEPFRHRYASELDTTADTVDELVAQAAARL